MHPARFDVYLTGRLTPGLDPATAAERLAQLFRSTPQVMANLVNGKPQVLKRGVDQATAAKYREALQRAGVEAAVREAAPAQTAPAAAATATADVASSGLSLAPPGADVLGPGERRPDIVADIDTSHIRLEAAAGISGRAVFGARDEAPPRVAVRTNPFELDNSRAGTFTLAPADADLLTDAERSAPPAIVPQAPELTLAEPGAMIDSLHQETQPVVADTSALSLAPTGADLLGPAERPAPPPPVAPDISRLRLAED